MKTYRAPVMRLYKIEDKVLVEARMVAEDTLKLNLTSKTYKNLVQTIIIVICHLLTIK